MTRLFFMRTLFIAITLARATDMAQASEPPVAAPGGSRWTQAELSAFTEHCTLAILLPAQQDYADAGERSGHPSPKPFPEALLRASIEPMCGCIGQRVADAKRLDDIASEGIDFALPFIEEAIAGGRCKPEGVLGEMLSRRPSR